ncbi:MAG: beta-galactosidase [Micropruina sp.]|uniref:beta-galactosidase n=1 Tax=Micropruina sp. TaxID=2737536 RepID=UPI0039E716E5
MTNPRTWPLPTMAFGGDWNPDQWPREVWQADIALMRRIGVNLVSLPVFAWPQLEPADGEYRTEWLAEILDALDAAGIGVALATGTATPPAWLVRRHPEVLPVRADGVRLDFGSRQSYCPSSTLFREKLAALTTAMATRFGDHPAVRLWHVSNEYGDHIARCWCDACAAAFRRWLLRRHGSLDGINTAWGTKVWGQVYGDVEQIDPPRCTPGPDNPARLLDFERFSSDNVLELFTLELGILGELTPGLPRTTNFMGLFRDLDYWRFADVEDLVSNDAYPDPAAASSHTDIALSYGLMRSLKSRPWLLIESAPSAVSWRPTNVPKAPGQLRAHALQAVAHGSDGAMFFQWRQARTGPERFHSAVVGHRGEASRSFAEASALGAELAALAPVVGSRVRSSVAFVVDWDTIWALRPDASQPAQRSWHTEAYRYHAALHQLELAVDAVALPGSELSRYAVIVAPTLYVASAEQAAALADYVRSGGTLVVGPFSGVVDDCERIHAGGPPGPLRELLGVEVDEQWPLTGTEQVVEFDSGARTVAQDWAEWIDASPDAEVVARYDGRPLHDRPAITRHRLGEGTAYYVSAGLDLEALTPWLHQVCADAGIDVRMSANPAVEVVTRTDGDTDYVFVLNHAPIPAEARGPADADVLLAPDGDPPVRRASGLTIALPPFGAAVLRLPSPSRSLHHIHSIEV